MLEEHECALDASGCPKLEHFTVEQYHHRGQVRLTLSLGQHTLTNVLWEEEANRLIDYVYRALDCKTKDKTVALCPWDLSLVVQKRTRPMGAYVLTIEDRMSDETIVCTLSMTTVRELARELTTMLRRSLKSHPAA